MLYLNSKSILWVEIDWSKIVWGYFPIRIEGVCMAHRLATEYIESRLEISKQEIMKLLEILRMNGITYDVVGENDDIRAIHVQKDQDHMLFTFVLEQDRYVFEGSFRLKQREMVNAMREIVAQFKGNAIVKRIYDHFSISYHYEFGTVVKIVEHGQERDQMIFERKHQHGEYVQTNDRETSTQRQLETLFLRTDVEHRIEEIRSEIDQFLDIRNRLKTSQVRVQRDAIDKRLRALSRKLLVLEAIS